MQLHRLCITLEQLRSQTLHRKEIDVGIWIEKVEVNIDKVLLAIWSR